MKKLLALILALMLALGGVAALADTVNTRITVDRDVAKELTSSFGLDEETQQKIDSALAVVNAIGVNVTTLADGLEFDLTMNDAVALALGLAMDDADASVVSTLFPNYCITFTQQTLATMAQQMAEKFSAAGGSDDANMMAAAQALAEYFTRYIAAVSAAATPGEPEAVEFEHDGYTFDTLVPVTVDIPAAIAATDALVDEMLADETLTAAIESSMKSYGQTFDEEAIRSAYDEWKTHMPEAATSEFYTISDDPSVFFLAGDAFLKDREEAAYHYEMLNKGDNAGTMGYWDYVNDMIMSLEYAEGAVRADITVSGMYLGFDFIAEAGQITCKLYFLSDAPLVCVDVTIAEGGERTLPVDAEGKTVLTVEDAMNDESGELVQGLLMDIMGNGIGALTEIAMQQVPELANMMGATTEG